MRAEIKFDPKFMRQFNRKMYAGHPAVIAVRELIQNAVDATRKTARPKIGLSIMIDDPKYVIQVTDNGIGMSLDDISNRFLKMPASSKTEDSESVGGFGIGIKVIILSGEFWFLHTRENYVDSSLIEEGKDIKENFIFFDGAKVGVTFRESGDDILQNILDIIYTSDIHIHLVLRNPDLSILFEDKNAGLPNAKKSLLIDKENFSVDAVRGFERNSRRIGGINAIRVNGLTQYVTKIDDRKELYIIDIKTSTSKYSPDYPFNASRESLRYGLHREIQASLNGLAKDKTSTEKKIQGVNDAIAITGNSFLQTMSSSERSSYDDLSLDDIVKLSNMFKDITGNEAKFLAKNASIDSMLKMGIIGKNDDNSYELMIMKVNFNHKIISQKWMKLLLAWGGIMELVGSEVFAIGFIGDKDIIAERRIHDNKTFYLVNPEYFDRLDWYGKFLCLYHIGIHEACHAKFHYHDEDFTMLESKISFETASEFYSLLPNLRKLIQ